MKKFLKTVWKYAFPIRQAYEWGLELFYVRVNNGAVYYEKSSTKLKKTLAGFAVLLGVYVCVLAFYMKLGGNPEILELSAKQAKAVRAGLTPGVLGVFVSLLTALGTWYGYLQNNYTKHKQAVISNFTPPKP